jgi:alpha-galactosidase
LVSVVTATVHAAPPFLALRLRGLDPALRYRVNGGDVYPGDVLMLAGYPLPMMLDDYQSLQLYLEAEK